VADTGFDDTHPDFAGRIVRVVALGRPGGSTDPHGHGTHVAGSALGDGSASGGVVRGTAPKAKLFFQSLLDKNNKLGGIPFRLETLFAEAYPAGARIHNNSWGSAAFAAYRMDARKSTSTSINKKTC
jgi:serine protease AprX